jgi:protein phosphatase
MTEIAMSIEQGPRENVEDAACGIALNSMTSHAVDAVFLVVADGAGGHRSGEIASGIAISQISALLVHALTTACGRPTGSLGADAIIDLLTGSFERAHQAILRRAAQDDGLNGMATTGVCALILRGVLYVAWVGDSRCYRIHKGKLYRCTRDHSQVQELVDAGLVDARDAAHHPLAHHITRCLGQKGELDVEVRLFPISRGDQVLVVTDGLTDVTSDEAIQDKLRLFESEQRPLGQLPADLTAAAIRDGTGDNATVLACEYQPPPQDARGLRETITEAYEHELVKILNPLTKGEIQ